MIPLLNLLYIVFIFSAIFKSPPTIVHMIGITSIHYLTAVFIDYYYRLRNILNYDVIQRRIFKMFSILRASSTIYEFKTIHSTFIFVFIQPQNARLSLVMG